MNAVLSDPTPAGLAFVSASPPCGGGFPCAIGDFPSGASTIISVTYAVDAGASGSVQNTATVGSDTPDPDSGDNTSMVTTPVVAAVFAADLALVKTGPADVTAGNNVVYTVVVTNNGPDAAANVHVVITGNVAGSPIIAKPAGWTCQRITGGTMRIECDRAAAMPSGSRSVITFSVMVPRTQSLQFNSTASSDIADPDGTNNSAQYTRP